MKHRFFTFQLSLVILSFVTFSTFAQEHLKWAEKPPMGWNSYNCFGAAVTENEVRGNAQMMKVHLNEFGWEYIVVDYCWYFPYVGAMNNPPQTKDFKPSLPMDEYSRLLPAGDRWSIARSPLMIGGDLTVIRPFELQIYTNKEILAVNQNSENNRQLFKTETHVVWVAVIPDSQDKYVAVFNISEGDNPKTEINLTDLGFKSEVLIHDLWEGKEIGSFKTVFSPTVVAHGAQLFKVTNK